MSVAEIIERLRALTKFDPHEACYGQYGGMRPHSNGEWVSLDDIEALIEELEQ
jgi:hypothetical protein